MAVGDIIVGLSSSNTLLVFQPAVGTSYLITAAGNDGTAGMPRIYNGANDVAFTGYTTTQGGTSTVDMKIFINNANYFYLRANGFISCYSGIQIQ